MKYIKYVLILVVLSVIFGQAIKYYRRSNTPPFLLEKFNELKSDMLLMDSIGGYRSFEYKFNRNDYKYGDTVAYTIRLIGRKKNVYYEATYSKSEENWKLVYEKMDIK